MGLTTPPPPHKWTNCWLLLEHYYNSIEILVHKCTGYYTMQCILDNPFPMIFTHIYFRVCRCYDTRRAYEVQNVQIFPKGSQGPSWRTGYGESTIKPSKERKVSWENAERVLLQGKISGCYRLKWTFSSVGTQFCIFSNFWNGLADQFAIRASKEFELSLWISDLLPEDIC